MSEATPKKGKGSMLGKVLLIVVGILVGITLLGAIVGGEEKNAKPLAVASKHAVKGQAEEPVDEEPESTLTRPQQNAVRSAEQYLSMSGFSREGLIGQLSSEFGDGYEVADATAAVDSLAVDWNEQAVRSAKQYLGMSGFSCKGLIGQLSSDFGDKYSKSQATYGAQQAGAC